MNNQRRIVYIHKEFQTRFIIKFCLVALAAMVIAGVLLLLLSKESLTMTYHYHHLAVEETSRAILKAVIWTNLIVFLGLLAATVLVTLYVSHKIGGPLYRLGKALDAIGRGDLVRPVQLRRRDQLMELADQVNTMTKGLRTRLETIDAEVARLARETRQSNREPEQIATDLERLRQGIRDHFQFEDHG
ncbi:MAG: hypothetical protein AUK55_01285 [Syntrophobacteraceae bacterium CG2_30_61_12]|nr:MAG: hypothetical protein AUK55_01285 [Syntrophobacteraceae bacterium CG2_30_61_12]